MPELADYFGVKVQALRGWYLDNPEFRAAIDEGRLLTTATVAGKLYERATGYDYTEEKSHVIDGRIEVVALRKHAPPDVSAQAKILAARRPEVWGNKVEQTVTGPGAAGAGIPTLDVKDMSPEMLQLMKRMLEAQIRDKEEQDPKALPPAG